MKKSFIINLICKILGKALPYVCSRDTRAYQTFKNLPENLTVGLGVYGEPDYIVLKKTGQKVVAVKKAPEIDLRIMFKNRKSAKRVMLGGISVAQSFARHDILLAGNINTAVALTRIIDIEEYYLFPRFITYKFLPKMKKQFYSLALYGYCLFGSAKKITVDDPQKVKELKKAQKLERKNKKDMLKTEKENAKQGKAKQVDTDNKKAEIADMKTETIKTEIGKNADDKININNAPTEAKEENLKEIPNAESKIAENFENIVENDAKSKEKQTKIAKNDAKPAKNSKKTSKTQTKSQSGKKSTKTEGGNK